jgi:tetratricopeptide (TPR) repeat protein
MAAVLLAVAAGGAHAQGAPVTSNVPQAAPAVAPPLPAPATPTNAPLELEAPHLVFDRPAPPKITEDPARTPDAPTAAAIAAAVTESDAVGGRALAEKALASSRIAYGPNDVRTLIPLINLAVVKQATGDLSGALVDYKAAVTLGENTAGPRDPRLFSAWYGIGTTNLQAGRFDDALEALATSLQLHRINEGLYDEGQIEILHAIALAQGALTKREDAVEVEQRRVEVAERVYGLGTPALAPVYNSVGRW